MTALLVAQPLCPSESAAAHGDGLPVVMLWLALAVIWSMGARPQTLHSPLRAGRCGGAGPGGLAVHRGRSCRLPWQSAARFEHALGMGGPGAGVLPARQLLHEAGAACAVVAAMIALTAAISVYGIYQYAIELPARQRQFVADPEGMLREAGLNLSARHAAPRPVREAGGQSRAAGHVCPDEFAGRGLGPLARDGSGDRRLNLARPAAKDRLVDVHRSHGRLPALDQEPQRLVCRRGRHPVVGVSTLATWPSACGWSNVRRAAGRGGDDRGLRQAGSPPPRWATACNTGRPRCT